MKFSITYHEDVDLEQHRSVTVTNRRRRKYRSRFFQHLDHMIVMNLH